MVTIKTAVGEHDYQNYPEPISPLVPSCVTFVFL